MKRSDPVEHLAGLGLWDEAREPREDTYWYLCTSAAATRSASGPLGSRLVFDAFSLRAPAPLASREEARDPRCDPASAVHGPYPLEHIARLSALERLRSEATGHRVALRLRGRRTAGNF